MIGGKVIETVETAGLIWVNCREYRKETDEMFGTPCAIYVEASDAARSISVGDIVWWQADTAYWTAKDRTGKTVGKPDTKLKRRGGSGVKRPEITTA